MYREEQLKAQFEGRKILIAGYGREGRSTERLIKSLLPEADITIADGSDCIREESGREEYDMVVKSPGVPMKLMKGDVAKVTSQVDIFLQVYADMVVGITGTKGKSTTSSLVSHLLPGSILAGNIGIPLFDIIDNLHEGVTVVAELSCHQLEVLHRSPHIAVILNFFQEHLDHYRNYDAYKMAKMQIALHQHTGDHFFYCTDNEELREMVEAMPVSAGEGACVPEGDAEGSLAGELHPYSIDDIGGEERELIKACPLLGEHNQSNAIVACRVAALVMGGDVETSRLQDVETSRLQDFETSRLQDVKTSRRRDESSILDILRSRLASFRGLRHRLELVPGDRRGIIWYNDSISTIPEATIAAMKALEPVGTVMTLILGGFDRGIDYMPLVEYLKEHPVRNLVFVGAAGRRMLDMFSAQSIPLPTHIVEDDYTKIVPWCAKHTHRRKICLLSPAAASYDSFRNFEARGDFYIEQINNLPGYD